MTDTTTTTSTVAITLGDQIIELSRSDAEDIKSQLDELLAEPGPETPAQAFASALSARQAKAQSEA